MRKDADVVATRVQTGIAGNSEQMAHFAQYLDYLRQRRAFVNKLNAARKDQGFEAARALFATNEDIRLLNLMQSEFDAMKATSQSQLDAEILAEERLQREIAWTEALALIGALTLLGGIALALTRSISKNVDISVGLVGAMAKKNLAIADGKPVGNDELSSAIHAINRMKKSITDALREVARSSAQVASAGAEIESTARHMSEPRSRMSPNMLSAHLWPPTTRYRPHHRAARWCNRRRRQ
jgi:methyl-accepting chemotaxis protein